MFLFIKIADKEEKADALPPALERAAIKASESGLPYPGFQKDLATARSHFENGKIELGRFVSNRILKQLKNLETGLPKDLVQPISEHDYQTSLRATTVNLFLSRGSVLFQ